MVAALLRALALGLVSQWAEDMQSRPRPEEVTDKSIATRPWPRSRGHTRLLCDARAEHPHIFDIDLAGDDVKLDVTLPAHWQ